MTRERGSTLVLALLAGVLLGGLAMATYVVVQGQTRVAGERARMLQAQAFVEAAMALKMHQIGFDDNMNNISGVLRVPPLALNNDNEWVPDWEPEDGARNGTLDAADVPGYREIGAWRAIVTPVVGEEDMYVVDASATVQGMRPGSSWTRAIIAVIYQRPPDPRSADGTAAVASRGMVTLTGGISVDGRNKLNIQPDSNLGDSDEWITPASAMAQLFPPTPGDAFDPSDPDGTWGVKTEAGVDIQGASATVGGNGEEPVNDAVDGTQFDADTPEDSWGNGIDDDGDGSVDEESSDGTDDDGDGLIDEDTHDFPHSPDAVVGAPEGTLKATAQANGTYFTSAEDFNNWVIANGENIPGGQVIYLDFGDLIPLEMGDTLLNTKPSILVHHHIDPETGQPAGYMKNLHGMFKGIILADQIDHVNGDGLILGGVMTLADDGFGHWFGNGAADIIFSEGVLANLPSLIIDPLNGYEVLAWQEVVR